MSTAVAKNQVYPLRPAIGLHRWLLSLIMIITIAVGWRWPVVGFTVPVAMMVGIGGAFFRGRYVCGNICPRGSFYDTFFRLIGGSRPVPALWSRPAFRWAVAALLMTVMALQIARNPTDPLHWGKVFWLVCLLTTAVGIWIGRYYNPRAWCAICPIGTMANAIGGEKYPLAISQSCRECGACEKSCPMNLTIATHKAEGLLPHRDCIKCSSCVETCSIGALSFPEEK